MTETELNLTEPIGQMTKVVSVFPPENRLVSCVQNDSFPHELRVTYRPNQVTQPVLKGSRLYVLKTYEDAMAWLHVTALYGIQVWECDVFGDCVEDDSVKIRRECFGELLKGVALGQFTWRDWLSNMRMRKLIQEDDLHKVKFYTVPALRLTKMLWKR